MDPNESALRSWVLKFYSLCTIDQEKIKSKLSQSEQEKLGELLAQIKALGIEQDSPLLGEPTLDDLGHQDVSSILLEKMAEVIPPFWYVLVGNKLFSDISLSKKPSYFKEYLDYKEHLKDFVLAPKMQATLDVYFNEKVSNEYKK
ncbi:hypothetical protein ACX1NX_01345 [Acinetobacter sp. ANC 5383]